MQWIRRPSALRGPLLAALLALPSARASAGAGSPKNLMSSLR